MNMSNLKYILSKESYSKWLAEKEVLKQAFKRDLDNIFD